ncbi:DUF58 domain-containing protein [uncultured Desulfobacter sp.]|uniref:DUF58 domain-containing protein n=1 Tax=uncultured Desulfobacter sp. TaxID=240139 RepID=UPI002AA8E823|nr:DUF58 domain-containing protein [uncultured Desulfobacter sp.]
MEKRSTTFLYQAYARFARFGFWRKNKFSMAGNFLIYALILTACLGLDTFRSTVYQLFSLLLSVFAVSAALSFKPPKGLWAKRILPEYGTAGTLVSYTILVENKTGRLKKGFEIRERFSNATPSLEAFANTREPHEHLRNPWDRKLKVHRWNWLTQQKQNAVLARSQVPVVPPASQVSIQTELTPLNRGYIYLKGFTFLKKEPLGFMRAFYHTTCEARLLVLPRRYRVPELNLPGSRKHHTGGIALTSKVGNSDEFISLREYRPGDPMRLIHWKSLAKTGKLIIRENRDEHFVRHALILDTHAPEGATQAFEVAVSIAASYAANLVSGESLLDLFFAGNRVYHYASGRGLLGNTKFLEILALIQSTTDKDFAQVSRAVLKYKRLLSGCILIFTCLDNERLDFLNNLRANGITTTAFLVAGEHEPAPGSPVYLIDPNNIEAGLSKAGQRP